MTTDTHRWIDLERAARGVYVARNPQGAELRFGSGEPGLLSPVELLLAAIAGCSATDVDFVTGRRAEPESFAVHVGAEKVRDDVGNILQDITLTFTVTFPEGEAGDQARAALPRAVQSSHARSCTVSRTVEAGTPVSVSIA
jgi:uncharacterized OsmC-like protein